MLLLFTLAKLKPVNEVHKKKEKKKRDKLKYQLAKQQ